MDLSRAGLKRYETRRPPTTPEEAIIKQPMVTASPIEGNSDCRARPFHSELYFDLEVIRQQQELGIHLDCSRDTLQRFYIFHTSQWIQQIFGSVSCTSAGHGPHLIQGTIVDSVLLRKELPPGMLLVDVLLWSNLFPLQHLVRRRGAILDFISDIRGLLFQATSLDYGSLFHFEEKVHRKKLQRADTIPLLFPRLLCHILEYMGYPTKPYLERRHHCRERFTLDKWTQLAGYSHL
ncbi:hypothetical protein CK203_041477 [Vitis vinifera]|uniref:Uncharacterized protein n=1 Tax=Vitis vinifera TaxID=29760 RepID=A0A438HNI5_VITVI|nr:hypothetical protein CK203_041477 [Vitis vinifera]